MSHHATLSEEAEQKLRAEKRNSTISSIIIALLFCALLVAILFYVALSPIFKNQEELVTYSSPSEPENELIEPEMSDQVDKKPSAPSASMSKVIASSTPSPTAIAVPDEVSVEPSLDFGDGDDFGDGWGGGGSGNGGTNKARGGRPTFFEQEVEAERVCFVIDYSLSMKGKKIDLLKKELTKSISALPDNIEYQLIFFAGPAWVAGDKVTTNANKDFTITNKGKDYEWYTSKNEDKGKGKRDPNGYRPKHRTKMQPVEWLTSSEAQRKKSLAAIKNTELVFGTVWEYPLKMALDMEPKPNVIFFMTDGTAGDKTSPTAKKMGSLGRKEEVIINCVALMEPNAKDAMAEIAKRTGGLFTMVDDQGKTEQQELK